MSSTADPVRRSCRMCGKPEHGSLACSVAPGWGDGEMVTLHVAGASISAEQQLVWAINRLAAAIEASNPASRQVQGEVTLDSGREHPSPASNQDKEHDA